MRNNEEKELPLSHNSHTVFTRKPKASPYYYVLVAGDYPSSENEHCTHLDSFLEKNTVSMPLTTLKQGDTELILYVPKKARDSILSRSIHPKINCILAIPTNAQDVRTFARWVKQFDDLDNKPIYFYNPLAKESQPYKMIEKKIAQYDYMKLNGPMDNLLDQLTDKIKQSAHEKINSSECTDNTNEAIASEKMQQPSSPLCNIL